MRGYRPIHVLLGGGLVLALSGCSFFSVRGPPKDHLTLDSFECTEGIEAPTTDVVAGAAGLGLAIWLGAGDRFSEVAATWGLLIGSGVAVVDWVSAFFGFRRVGKCRDAKRALEERLGGGGGMP